MIVADWYPTRILLVDDNQRVREALGLHLEGRCRHCVVRTAESGTEALTRLAGESFDVVLCDLKLRGPLDGIGVARELHTRHPAVRVVVFTGGDEGERKKEALAAGAFSYLSKPVDYDELLHTIQTINAIRRTERIGDYFKALAHIASDLQATFDFHAIAQRIVDGACELGYTRARLYLLEPERQVLRGQAACGMGEESDFRQVEIPLDAQPIIQHIFSKERPTVWNKAELLERFPESALEPWITQLKLTEIPWIDCPLRVENRRIGTLAVDHLGETDVQYTQQDVEIMGLFAALAAQALNNSRLYDKEALARASLSSLLHDAPDAVFTTDLHGIINYVSPSAEQVTGWPRAKLLGQPASRFYTDAQGSPDSGDQVAGWIMEELRAGRTIANQEIHILTPEGRPRPVSTSVNLLHDPAGHAIGTLAFVKGRTLLEGESRRYRDLLEGFGYGTLLLTRGGRVEFINRKAENLLRLSRNEARKSVFADLLLETQRDQFLSTFQEVLAGQTEEEGLDLNVRRPDGSRVALKARLTPTRSGAEITGVALALYDMEELAALIQSGRLMALGQMVAGVSHEIVNPLNNLLMATRALRDRLRAGEQLVGANRRDVEILEHECQRIEELVERMKDFARPSDFRLASTSLNAVIENAAAFFATRLRTHDVDLRLELDPGLPPILGDRKRLQQVIVNLIINAEEAMAEQSEPKEIVIATHPAEGGQVEVMVSDSGSGIPEGVRDAIFDPFFTTKANGTGLGLSICKTIMDLHRGSIHATDRANRRGTTFHLTLQQAS